MHLMNLAGIPLRVHWSFLALFAVGCVVATTQYGLPGLGLTVVIGGAMFWSVALHELGHALAARKYGIQTQHITLYPYGGIAALGGMPRSAREELVIALAGPAVNIVLFAASALLAAASGSRVLTSIAAMNLLMGVFNLIPAFPMDGGRVLRAWLSTRMGWFKASDTALKVGKVFAWIFTVVGVATFNPGLLMVGGFLHYSINSERKRLAWEWTYARSTSGYGKRFRFV